MTFEEWYAVNHGANTNEEHAVARGAWNAAVDQCEDALLQRREMHKHAGRKTIAQWVMECYSVVRSVRCCQ